MYKHIYQKYVLSLSLFTVGCLAKCRLQTTGVIKMVLTHSWLGTFTNLCDLEHFFFHL